MRLATLILTLVIISSCSKVKLTAPQADDTPSATGEFKLKFPVIKKTLSNGLRVLIVENGSLPIASYYTYYDIGAKYETEGMTGATHFLEHLLFKGIPKPGLKRFDHTIEENGGSSNAYTTWDNTVYYESFPVGALDDILEWEADRMVRLRLPPGSFESERNVILEERKLRYENRPSGQLHLAMSQAVFEGTPYGGSVIGKVEDLKKVTEKQIIDYFHDYYAPNNAIIVIVGKVDPAQLLKKIEDKFGGLKPSKKVTELKEKNNDKSLYRHQGRYNREIALHGSSPTPLFTLAFKGEPLGTKKSFVMDILASILSDGASSYLSQKWVQSSRPWASSIHAGNWTLRQNGVFYIGGNLLRGKNLRKFKRALVRDFRSMCNKAITERAIQKTKNQYLVRYFRELESNSGIASFIGDREFYYDDYKFYQDEIAFYNNTTKEDLMEACEELFSRPEYIFINVWNKNKKARK